MVTIKQSVRAAIDATVVFTPSEAAGRRARADAILATREPRQPGNRIGGGKNELTVDLFRNRVGGVPAARAEKKAHPGRVSFQVRTCLCEEATSCSSPLR
jgi:hypothetical protein